MPIIQIHPKDFGTEVLKADKLTLVLFWASWSHPSKEIYSLLKDMSETHSENVKFVVIDVDHAGELPEYYSVLNVPTVLFFWKHKEIGRTDGVNSARNLEYVIEKILKVLGKAHEIPQ
jgi:thioredoxin 1